MFLRFFAITNIGLKRNNNEDLAIIQNDIVTESQMLTAYSVDTDSPIVVAVADGMGGQNGGEVASRLIIESLMIWRHTLPNDADFKTTKKSITDFTKETHRFIQKKAQETPDLYGMGSTLISMVWTKKTTIFVNIGDSRLYLFRDKWLKQISNDHSMRNLTHNPDTPSNLIYNSLGSGETSFADISDITTTVKEDDIYLLCSDGLSDMISDNEIETILRKGPSATNLLHAAINAGGRDNITIILIQVKK
ncbi:MAG: protein phosphatase 2C domain-containing protein [Bacteroidaceae bacterium]